MKKYFILAAAALAMVACSKNEAPEYPNVDNGEQMPLVFGGSYAATTRATIHNGSDAAGLLDENFVVEGIKYAPGQVEVFDHYNVNWATNTAGSTESNTNDWEYVGQNQNIKGTSAKLSGASAQTIKYWDYAASQYDFIAVSLGKGADDDNDGATPNTFADLSTIDYSKLGSAVDGSGHANAVYTLTGTYGELSEAYIADLVSKYKADGEFGATNVITPQFRRAGAKVRIAFYDQVPGYAVTNIKFYTTAWDGSTATSTPGQDNGCLFTENAFFVPTTGDGILCVYYPVVGYANKTAQGYNKAVVKYETAGATLGTTMTFGAVGTASEAKEDSEQCGTWIGRTTATATYAGAAVDNGYVTVIPQGKGENLQIRIEYDLYPIDGAAEVIHVRDARAVVPAAYANWQPNYAYTYIFKISDNTNGWTGVDAGGNVVEGLTPITFDAWVVDTEDAMIQETVTEVATPSITTYALGTNGVDPTTGVEYNHGQNIYVSVAGETLTDAKVALYTATLSTSPASIQTISEASVANALENGTPSAATYVAATGTYDSSAGIVYYSDDQGTIQDMSTYTDGDDVTLLYVLDSPASMTVTDINGGTLTVAVAVEAISVVTKIDGADRVDGVDVAGNFAVFKPTAAGKYVFEYNDGAKKHYKVITVY